MSAPIGLLVGDLTEYGRRLAAEAAGVTVGMLLAWGRGDGRPTPDQAEAMERATRGALRAADWRR